MSIYSQKKLNLIHLVEQERYQEAASFLATMEIDADDIEMYIIRSVIASSLGEVGQAINILEEAYKCDPYNSDLVSSLVILYNQNGDCEKATQLDEKYNKNHKEINDLDRKIKKNITSLIANKEYSKAEVLIEEYLSFMEIDEHILYFKSEILVLKILERVKSLIEVGEIDSGKKILLAYQKNNTDSIDVYSIRGVIALIEGNLDEAEECLKIAFNLDPNSFDILFNMGYLYQAKNQMELAIQYFQKSYFNAISENDRKDVKNILSELGYDTELVSKDNFLTNEKQETITKYDNICLNIIDKIIANIKILALNNQLDQAYELINIYNKFNYFDVKCIMMEKSIQMMFDFSSNFYDVFKAEYIQGDFNKVNYVLARAYRECDEYLKAIEAYESIIFQLNDSHERLGLIKELNSIENEYREIIRFQMENSSSNNSTSDLKKKVRLHLLYDSQYCDKFIEFVNAFFPCDEHYFVVIGSKESKMNFVNVENIENVEILDLQLDLRKLLLYMKNCDSIFIHFLFDYFCELVCKFNISKPIYWPIWGGDLYNYLDINMYDTFTNDLLKKIGVSISGAIDKNDINYIYRKSTIRKIDYFLSFSEHDVNILKNNFLTKGQFKKFIYPNPAEVKSNTCVRVDSIRKIKKFKNVILVGNSGNPSNNHLDVFEKLLSIPITDFCVVVPLSYGGFPEYIEAVIKVGEKYFNNRFYPITEYLSPEDYKFLLEGISFAIFGHNRQQAVGNIRIILELGKTVYIKESISTFNALKDIGIQGIKTIDDLDSITLVPDYFYENDINNLDSYFGSNEIVKCLSDIFKN